MDGVVGLGPLEQRSTADLIADRIRARIVDGRLVPGSQLGEAQLAGQLEVSRGPVREALQRLIQEGLLEGRRNRGVFVVTLDERDVADVYLARSVIERAATGILLDRRDEPVLNRLAELVASMQRAVDARDWSRIAEADLTFHETVVAASGSRRLVRMFATLIAETRMCLAALEMAYPRPEEIVAKHQLLLDALRTRAADEALDLVDAHMTHAIERLSGGTRTSAGSDAGWQ